MEAQRELTYSGRLSSESAAGLEPGLGRKGQLGLILSHFFLCQRFLSTHTEHPGKLPEPKVKKKKREKRKRKETVEKAIAQDGL